MIRDGSPNAEVVVACAGVGLAYVYEQAASGVALQMKHRGATIITIFRTVVSNCCSNYRT